MKIIRKAINYIVDHNLQRLLWKIVAKLCFGIAQALIIIAILRTEPLESGIAACFALLLLAIYIAICLRVVQQDI